VSTANWSSLVSKPFISIPLMFAWFLTAMAKISFAVTKRYGERVPLSHSTLYGKVVRA